MAAKAKDDIAAMSFEDALAALEEIVGKLEGGETSLEDSITLYERGARLRAHCERKLGDAELRVEKIVKGEGDAPAKTAPFDQPSASTGSGQPATPDAGAGKAGTDDDIPF